jgi:hypothetical protein
VWFPLPAPRANTIAAGSDREATAHAAGPLVTPTLTTPTASSFRPASSIHKLSPPVGTSYSFHPAAATRHGKSIPIQVPIKPSLDDLTQIAGHKWNDQNAVCSNHFLQIPGDGSADQSADTQLCKAQRFLNRQLIAQKFLCFIDSLSSLSFNKMDFSNHIKDRCNSIFPSRKCCFHFPNSI